MTRTATRTALTSLAVVAGGFAVSVALSALTSQAQAAEVVRSCNVVSCDRELFFRARDGERNVVQTAITNNEGRRYWIWDSGARITLGAAQGAFAGNGCEHRGPRDSEFPFTDDARRENVVACRWGGDGRVVFRFGDRDDRSQYGISGPGVVFGEEGRDSITGGVDLFGGAGDDYLAGEAGAESLFGGDGNDTLDGGLGPDDLSGGPGTDTVQYAKYIGNRARIFVTIGDGRADDGQRFTLDEQGDALERDGRLDDVRADVENVEGTPFSDVLEGDGSRNVLIGFGGDDRLFGNGGEDTLFGGGVIFTSEGSFGFGGDNRLFGGDGSDYLVGGFGDDLLEGEAGNDELRGDDPRTSEGRDNLNGGPGDDVLDGGRRPLLRNGEPSADTIAGGLGVDRVFYGTRAGSVFVSLDNAQNDGETGESDNVFDSVEEIIGGSGADLLMGSRFENFLAGGEGDDIINGGLGADDLAGGEGADTVLYSDRAEAVVVSLDNRFNDGQQFSQDGKPVSEGDNVRTDVESVVGGSGPDELRGDGGSNQLYGGDGDDTITGGDDKDILDGQDGKDTFFARDGVTDRVLGGPGTDSAEVDESDQTYSIENFL